MRKCPRCAQIKSIELFRPNRTRYDGYQQYCIPCDKEYQKEWYAKNKEKHKEKNLKRGKRTRKEAKDYILHYLKSNPCVVCGETDPVVLEFNHLNNKTKAVCQMIANGTSIEIIKKEICKCEVVCANCHKRKTAKDFNWYKLY